MWFTYKLKFIKNCPEKGEGYLAWLNVLIKERESLRFGVLEIRKKVVWEGGWGCQFITETQARRQFLASLSNDSGTEGKLMTVIYIQGGCVYS